MTTYTNDPRDQAVYRAELWVRQTDLPQELHLITLHGCQEYVDDVLARDWVQWPKAAPGWITVRYHKDRTAQTTDYRSGVIWIPENPVMFGAAARELVLLHEIAHGLCGGLDQGHGPAFVEALLTLVDGMLGRDTAVALNTEYHREGVNDVDL